MGDCPLTTPLSQSHHDGPLRRSVSVLSYYKRHDAPMKTVLNLLLALAVLAPLSARADDDDDQQERITLDAAIARGEILPLTTILDRTLSQIKGRIVEIEFENDDGRPIYEIYIVNSQGRRLEYEIDARTAEILGLKDED